MSVRTPMTDQDEQRRTGRRDTSGVSVFIQPPTPYAGIERALRHSFGSAPALPEDLNRLLNRLR